MNEWIEGLAWAGNVFALVEVPYQQLQEGNAYLWGKK